MAQQPYVERSESGSGMAAGMMIGIAVVILAVVVALFLLMGGVGRFTQAPAAGAPNTTNVTVPAPAQAPPAAAPQINIPRAIDVNINQPAAPAAQ